jgi:hypothetical protein
MAKSSLDSRDSYRPRTQSKRWRDADCPDGVLAIYDNRGKTADRYTVIYKEVITAHDGTKWIGMRHMSENPTHPQGVGMFAEERVHDVAAMRYRMRACTWSSLPDKVKDCVRRDLSGE